MLREKRVPPFVKKEVGENSMKKLSKSQNMQAMGKKWHETFMRIFLTIFLQYGRENQFPPPYVDQSFHHINFCSVEKKSLAGNQKSQMKSIFHSFLCVVGLTHLVRWRWSAWWCLITWADSSENWLLVWIITCQLWRTGPCSTMVGWRQTTWWEVFQESAKRIYMMVKVLLLNL